MTRRVRFTPWTAAGLVAATLTLARPPLAHATDIPFVAQPPISTAASGPIGVLTADFDRDGDLDVLPVLPNDDTVSWRENVAGDGSAWTTRTITTSLGFAIALSPADVDGDGDVDVIAALLADNAVVWLENVAGNGSKWATHAVSTVALSTRSVSAGDLDKDGDVDVAVTLGGPDVLGWYENVGGSGTNWVLRTIATGLGSGRLAVVADMDVDGDADVLTSLEGPDALMWYDNALGNGSAWAIHTISTGARGAYAIVASDVDHDGDPDVVAPGPGDTISWYENTHAFGFFWAPHTLATGLPGAVAAFTADLDGDGDADVLSASYDSGTVAWHENTAGNATQWTTRTLGTAAGALGVHAADMDGDGDVDVLSAAQDAGTVAWSRNETTHATTCFAARAPIHDQAFDAWQVDAADMDNDGDTDVLSASSFDDTVGWYRNHEGDGTVWLEETLATVLPQSRGVHAADLNGDGDMDVLGFSFQFGLVAWFENTGSASTFQGRALVTLPFGPRAVLAADLDGDGDRDVVMATNEDNRVFWMENVTRDGLNWAMRTITTTANLAWSAFSADVDGDGDTDVLSASVGDTKAAWYENTDGSGMAWAVRTITTAAAGIRTIRTADMDGDGDLDALATTDGTSSVVWYENLAGNGSLWATRTIATGLFLPYAAAAADLDGDGDADVLSTGLTTGVVTMFENADGAGSLWTSRAIATGGGFGLRSIETADVDGDGDLDPLYTTQFLARVDWLDNQRGQLSLVATDIAPTLADNGALLAMLRLDATHLGRAGDHDLELASLGLLFEEEPDQPLETIQANALVESLRVYRDGNGNGVFDPGVDVLIANVPTLSLDGGVQTIAFADGDPEVRIAFGAPRTYFVAVELTADASQQSPSRFRITHLGVGARASRAEDRDYDVPLRIACPANVPSGFKQVLPVQLMRFTVE